MFICVCLMNLVRINAIVGLTVVDCLGVVQSSLGIELTNHETALPDELFHRVKLPNL